MRILLVGLGALGSRVAQLLLEQGFTELTFCDFDIVQKHNLARAPLYTTEDIGIEKVVAAKMHLCKKFPHANITVYDSPFTDTSNIDGFDLVVEGTDSLETRHTLTKVTHNRVPLVIGAASGTQGLVFLSISKPCWSCITTNKSSVADCDDGLDDITLDTVARTQVNLIKQWRWTKTSSTLYSIAQNKVTPITVLPNKQCSVCIAQSTIVTQAPYTIQTCRNRGTTQVRPSQQKRILLDSLPGIQVRYQHAARISMTVFGHAIEILVHDHGLLEIENATEQQAQTIAQAIYLENTTK